MMKGCLPTTQTFFDGLFLAVNALPDSCLVLDCPSCGYDKPGKTGVNHDFASTLVQGSGRHRVFFSRLESDDLVMGSEDKLKRRIKAIAAELKPPLILVTQSSIVLLMGADTEAAVAELESETGAAIAVVPSDTLSGDWLAGYAAAMETVAKKLPLTNDPSAAPDSAAIVGYLMDRLEEDQQSNLRELRRLFDALSIDLNTIMFDGTPFTALSGAAKYGRIISFPYGEKAAGVIGARLGVSPVSTELPIGLEGATRFMRFLGGLFGREKEAEVFIEKELETIVPRLEWIVRRMFANRNVAIAADPHTAPGLAAYLAELGMNVRAVALRSRNNSDSSKTEEALKTAGQSAQIIVDPAFPELEALWCGLKSAEKLDFIIGTGSERDAAKSVAAPFLELGYPSYVRHALFDAPWLGFRGALKLADSIFNLLNEWEYRTY